MLRFAFYAVVCALVAAVGCGGSSRPSTPSPVTTALAPTPTPTPTPTPPVTFRLDAAADVSQFSRILATLTVGQTYEFDFTPLWVNFASNNRFAYTFEFWLDSAASNGTGVGIEWLNTTSWHIFYFEPGPGFQDTSRRINLPLVQKRRVRVSRGRDGVAEFFLDDLSLIRLNDPGPSKALTARVVGTGAEYTYIPNDVRSTATLDPRGNTCLFCQPQRRRP